jgi:hypothetical protein
VSPDIDPAADALKRAEWANGEGEALKAEIDAYIGSNPYSVWVQTDGEEGTATLCRMIDPAAETEIFDGFARRIGAHLDHLRAGLNYMTYQLAVFDRETNPAVDPDVVEFPIFTDPVLYKQKNRVKKLSDQHRALIESVQPYDGQRPGLWALHELAREYRHRILHPTRTVPLDDEHGLAIAGAGRIVDYEILHSGPVLNDKTPVLWWQLADTDASTKIHVDIAITVGIDHPLCEGRNCIGALNEMGQDAAEVARALSAVIPITRMP